MTILRDVGRSRRPLMLVFDLDFTLWPLHLDKNARSPFFLSKKGNVMDSKGRKIESYPEVSKLLETLNNEDYLLAVASRIEDIAGAYQLLHLLQLTHYFQYKTIFPGTKTAHFQLLHLWSTVNYADMLFFDDDKRNIRDISKLGVESVLVPQNGISFEIVNNALETFARKHESNTSPA